MDLAGDKTQWRVIKLKLRIKTSVKVVVDLLSEG